MPRTSITPETPLGGLGDYSSANSADFPMAATTGLSGSSGNQFVSSGNDLVYVKNTQAGTQTITFTSVDDPQNRQENITAYELLTGEYAVFGPFGTVGWRQTDNKIYFETSHIDVLVAIFALP